MFADPALISDALIFAQRSARLADGAVRLQTFGSTLAMTAAPLAARGLLDRTPTVLALRALSIEGEQECDVVVAAADISVSPEDPLALLFPAATRRPPWSAISPPRSGWASSGAVQSSSLASSAQWGIAAVADALPASPGEEVVHSVRAAVWGEADPDLSGLPRGAAFAAFVMGFIVGDETAPVLTAGSWTRISLGRGHVLVRRRGGDLSTPAPAHAG